MPARRSTSRRGNRSIAGRCRRGSTRRSSASSWSGGRTRCPAVAAGLLCRVVGHQAWKKELAVGLLQGTMGRAIRLPSVRREAQAERWNPDDWAGLYAQAGGNIRPSRSSITTGIACGQFAKSGPARQNLQVPAEYADVANLYFNGWNSVDTVRARPGGRHGQGPRQGRRSPGLLLLARRVVESLWLPTAAATSTNTTSRSSRKSSSDTAPSSSSPTANGRRARTSGGRGRCSPGCSTNRRSAT